MKKKKKMMEKNECMSGYFKSHGSLMNLEPVEYSGDFTKEYSERVRDQVLEKGRVRHKMIYKTVKPGDKFKGIKASDFDLENLIALGALDGMKECQLSGSNLEDADRVEGSIDNLINAVDREEGSSKEGGNE